MRIAGLDVGLRRIGIAVSDATATLARPVRAVETRGLNRATVDTVAAVLAELIEEGDDPIATVVVGWPRRLDGSPTDLTAPVVTFAADLRARLGVDVVLQDERLSSVEAESRLALRERDWRVRKQRIDATAAAVILQDYLDTRPGRLHPVADDPEF